MIKTFRELQEKYPEEYNILKNAIKRIIDVATDPSLDPNEFENIILTKPEKMQLAAALLRRAREERDEFKNYMDQIGGIIGNILKGIITKILL